MIYIVTQVLGQPIESIVTWLKLPPDIFAQVVDMKANPEKYKDMVEQKDDAALWDSMFGGTPT